MSIADTLRTSVRRVKTEARRLGSNRKVFDSIIPLRDRPLDYVSHLEGRTIEESEVAKLIDAGDVIIVRDLIGKLGLQPKIDELISSYFNVDYADLSRIHELKSIEAIVDASLNARRSTLSLQIQSSIISRILQPHSAEYYIELDPNIRLHLPYNYVSDNENYIESRMGRGKMNPHGQHKDSWRGHPPKTLNIWVALTNTGGKNGMSVLPKSMPYFPKYGEKEIHPSCKTYMSRQYVTELKAGDAVVFMADLLHGSIINMSEDTRVAFSMRGSIPKPEFHKEFIYNYIGVDQGRFKSLAVEKALGRNDWLPEPRDIAFEQIEASGPALDVVAKSGSEIQVRHNDEVLTFPRRCPHKGADMLLGELDKDGNLLCPWHRMCISPKTKAEVEKQAERLA